MKNSLITVLACLSAFAALSVEVTVDPSQVLAEVPRTLYGIGMEDVNHEIYGGLDRQLLFGESFEEPSRWGRANGPRENRGRSLTLDNPRSAKRFRGVV